MKTKKYFKYLEIFSLTTLPPLIIITYEIQKYVIPIIIFFSFLAIIYLKKNNYSFRLEILKDKKPFYKLLLRSFIICLVLFYGTYLFFPDHFILLPILNLKLWLLIILLYPIISAFPQELLFRVFFFYRYSDLFKNQKSIIFFNGFVFGLMHSIYLNIVVVFLAFIAGILFAKNYYCNKSIFLVTLEHSILGNIIFSIGLGHFFYHGNIKYIYSIL